MTNNQSAEEIDNRIIADQNYAQILIKIADASKSDQEAEKLIERLGLKIISINRLSPHWVLFKLNVRDMREVALKLTEEYGFTVKGINALPQI